ncbi:MAG TPA: PepSY-like domain-containing protein [Aquaticitalea sp.]|nr:PepSY-like domain-containing protein [Aquaticitalea sp.]HNU58504.1 PepSY-like domain-containing protein [Aquaticitalea sp.]
MKKLVLATTAILVLAFTGVSCSSDDDDNASETIIDYSELSVECTTFVETYFNGYEVLRVEKGPYSVDEYYEITFVGGTQIDLNASCEWTEVDGNDQAIPTGFINTSIVEYVSTNYPTTAIESIDKKTYGFDVDLVDGTELRFDSEGNFLGLDN